MITHLRGTIHRQNPGEVAVDVHGVGYGVLVPLTVWEELREGEETTLFIATYVREDRFDLFGFSDREGRLLFEELIQISGVGPKTGLELCAVSRHLLAASVSQKDPSLLTNVKGIGKKTAEKLLLELASLAEKHPGIFCADGERVPAQVDADAVAALNALGYDAPTIMNALRALPSDLATTEERVAAALRSL